MLATANMFEIHQILDAEHGDPHHVLGMHEIVVKGKKALVIRAFVPNALKITAFDSNNYQNSYELNQVHMDGFFERVIKERDEWFSYYFKIEDIYGNKWTSYDPYSFEPTVSDLDCYLFNQGNHYEIFDKLGAHVKKINGVEGVSFATWAPNAKRVSVIGDFNAWDGRRNPMRTINNSGIWEIFIPGLKQFDKYKFEIKSVTGQLFQKSDPYANFAELRPSTSSLVYDINKHNWNDNEWVKNRDKETRLNVPINIYEVHLGSWRRVGEENRFLSYVELTETLIPYVKEMGYTHIELMPIEEYPFDGSWGYQVTGYYAPTSRYGTPDEFMDFIDKCHENNIGVILDWVPAHFPKDAHGLAKFDGTALYEHQDPKQGEHPDWGTLIFNYGRNEVKNFLIANALFWIEKYHLDGLRVDAVASMLYLDYGKKSGEWIPNKYGGNENLEAVEFMKHMNSIIDQKHPGALMIAEESTAWANVSAPAKYNGLGFKLKWNMGWMHDFLEYIEKDPVHRKYHHSNLTFGMVYAYTERFVLVLSHDEVVHGKRSLLDKMPGDLWQKFANLRASYGFMYTHPGKKLIFMGGEFGQFVEWNENKSLDWFLLEYDTHKGIQKCVKDLNHLYKNEKALWEHDFDDSGFEWIDSCDENRSIYSYVRKGTNKEDTIVVVCNFTPVPHMNFRVGVPYEGCYREIFNSDNSIYGGSGIINSGDRNSEKIHYNYRENSIGFDLPPLGVTIFKLLH